METLQLLKASRDYFAAHGGLKHQYRDEQTGKVCAVGAVHEIWNALDNASSRDINRVVMALNRATIAATGERLMLITSYNDAEHTTPDNVLAVFDKAIQDLEEVTENG